jgi:hypothetical protein
MRWISYGYRHDFVFRATFEKSLLKRTMYEMTEGGVLLDFARRGYTHSGEYIPAFLKSWGV